MADDAVKHAAVASGLRVGLASALCLLVTEALHLPGNSALSVYSVHLIMAQFTFTAFQKSVERMVGRILGVGYGLVLVILFREAPLVFRVLTFAGTAAFFYAAAANRLAYLALGDGERKEAWHRGRLASGRRAGDNQRIAPRPDAGENACGRTPPRLVHRPAHRRAGRPDTASTHSDVGDPGTVGR
jgi:hypothetical protein